MKRGLLIAFALLSARMVLSLEITSFTAQGVITFECAHDQGLVTAETLCDLGSDEGWVKVGEVTVTGSGGSITVPVCTNEAYYRLLYYASAADAPGMVKKALPGPPTAAGKSKTSANSSEGSPAGTGSASEAGLQAGASESVVAVKTPGGDDYVLLEEARQNIRRHWRIIYPTPLVFTNAPGSQADLQDLADALNKLSGKFFRVQ